MLKLVSDPTVYPIREVDFATVGGRSSIVDISFGDGIRDRVFPRRDGGQNVMFKPTRTQVELTVSGFRQDQGDALEQLIGSSFGRDRTLVRLTPSFDRHTWFSAPLTGSLACYRRDGANGCLEKTAITHTRASELQTFDEAGNVVTHASGVPAFVPSVIGKGLYISSSLDANIFPVPHPTSGAFGWTAGGGTTLSWDDVTYSPYRAAGGSLRLAENLTGNTGYASVSGNTGVSVAGTYFHMSVMVRGRGRVQFACVFTDDPVAGTFQSGFVDLTEDWQTVTLLVQQPTTVDSYIASLSLQVNASHTAVMYVGPAGMYERKTSQSVGLPPHWQSPGTRADDDLRVSDVQPTTGGTFAVCGLIPKPEFAETRLFYSLHLGAGFYPSGSGSQYATLVVDGDAVQLVDTDLAWVPGEPFVFVGRHRSDGSKTLEMFTGGSAYRADDTAYPSFAYNANDYDLRLNILSSPQAARGTAPQFYRFDGRVWSDAEVKSYARLFEYDGLRNAVGRTAGRIFRVTGHSLRPQAAVVPALEGGISLEEVDRDPDFLVYE